MAIAGGGSPGVKLHIYNRKLRQLGLAHNVPEQVIKTPGEAAEIIAAGGSCYVDSIAAIAWEEVAVILRDKGLID